MFLYAKPEAETNEDVKDGAQKPVVSFLSEQLLVWSLV